MASTTIRIQARDESRRAFNQARDNARGLSTALLAIGPALAPVAAAGVAGVVALGSALAGAAVAAGAFTLAVKPQVKMMQEHADTAKKVADAQEDAANKQQVADKLAAQGSSLAEKAQKAATSAKLKAIQAENEYARATKDLPKGTADAALSLAKLKKEYEGWSASLAGDTMPVFTKGINVLRAILPTLTPIVKSTAKVFNELMGSLEKKVKGEGFKRFMEDVAKWSESGLKKTINGIIAIGKAVGGFVMSPGFREFLQMGGQAGGDIGTILKKLAQFAVEFVKAAGPLAGLSFAALGVLADALNAIPKSVLEVLAPTIMAIVLAIKAWRIAVMAYTAAQWLLNAALAANPIGLLVGLIAGLVVALVVLWKKNEGFRNAVITAWNGIKQGVGAAASAIMGFYNKYIKPFVDLVIFGFKWLYNVLVGNSIIPDMVNAILRWFKTLASGISSIFNAIKNFFISVWNRIASVVSAAVARVKSLIQAAVSRIKGILNGLSTIVSQVAGFFSRMRSAVSDRVSALLSLVRGIPGRVKGALGNLGGLLVNAGRNIIKGLINGVSSMIGSLRSKFSSITNMIPDWKGPMTVDAKLLTPNGKAIMGGLMKGVDMTVPRFKNQLGKLTNEIPTSTKTGISKAVSSGTAGSTGSSGGNKTFIINIAGRNVAELLWDDIRKEVRVRGGDVQVALGR